jgi:hypothetical protein
MALVVSLQLISCKTPDPSWVRIEQGTPGDSTVTGEPARVPRAASAPIIDGRLDDAVWSGAAQANSPRKRAVRCNVDLLELT